MFVAQEFPLHIQRLMGQLLCLCIFALLAQRCRQGIERNGKFRVLAGQSPGPERDFELWAVPTDGGPPKAIGLISGSRDSALQLDRQLGRSVRMAQVLAVSVEPAGGSPAAGPTGPVRFSGALQQI